MRKIFFLLCIFLFFPTLLPSKSPTFIDGVRIQGHTVEGLTSSQAKKKLAPFVRKILDQKVILIAPKGRKIWVTNYKNMGVKLDLEKAVRDGLAIGNKGFFLRCVWERLQIKARGLNIPLQLTIDKTVAVNNIRRLAKCLARAPQNAKLIVLPNNKIDIKPDISGIEIDINTMFKHLKQKLNLHGPISVQVLLKEKNADIREQDLKDLKVETLLGQFTTYFNPKKENRSLNIKTAAKALDNFILPPQKEFSFNEIVGPRTKEAGYNEAPIILNNQFAQGIGGGVCQVSSTLYNALLRANLVVTERFAHSLPVRYVPKGLDAAVVYGFKDLKFINNTPGHILIKTYVSQGSLTVKIFGSKKENIEVELVSIIEKIVQPKTIIKNQSELLEDQAIVEQEGIQGYIVRVERIIRDSRRKVLVHEILTRDYYPPVDKIIIVATNP